MVKIFITLVSVPDKVVGERMYSELAEIAVYARTCS